MSELFIFIARARQMLLCLRVNLSSGCRWASFQKKKKKSEEIKWKMKEMYIVIAVQCVAGYTACSSMTAGNAGLDVALRVSF